MTTLGQGAWCWTASIPPCRGAARAVPAPGVCIFRGEAVGISVAGAHRAVQAEEMRAGMSGLVLLEQESPSSTSPSCATSPGFAVP